MKNQNLGSDTPGEYLLNDILKNGEVPGFGAPHEFLDIYRNDVSLQNQKHYQQLHRFLTERASVCSFCGVGCPYTVVKNRKDKERLIPLSDLGLCVKGQSSLITGSDSLRPNRLSNKNISDDRIRAPMIRGHNGELKEVSWDEALDRAAWLFLHTREWVGKEAIGIYGNGQKTVEAIWMASLYKLVFNVPTLGANSEHCLSSAGAGHVLNFGNEASFTWREFSEVEHADVIILHGTNPKITFPQAFEKIKRNTQATKVVIDPVRSDTAADLLTSDSNALHIRFEQGGEILFNLAVARIIFENNWQDQAYLDANVDKKSIESFKRLCFEERCEINIVAEQIALVEDSATDLAETIFRYAELIAKPLENGDKPRPAFISSMGINQSTGSFGFSSNLNLLLLTGNVGRKGAGSLRIAGQSNATSELMLGFNSRKLVFNLDPKNDEHREELANWLDIPIHNIPNTCGTPVAKMADDDYLYCFIFIGTQFTKNMPRLGHWLRRLGRSFNIVIDSFLGEGVADYADVVFPSFTYTERTGVIQRGDRSLQLQQGISPPPVAAWSDEQILARLAMKIAERLENPDTALLNKLDPKVVARTFGRYVDSEGFVDPAGVFDHVVATSQHLGVYNRLEDKRGEAISHKTLAFNAGIGVQWQGDGRYAQAVQTNGRVNESANKNSIQNAFPNLKEKQKTQARLVCPPDELLQRLIAKGDDRLRSLITGRGRPGIRQKHYIARYNSGIKTLAVTGEEDKKYWIEVHPSYAQKMHLAEGDLVRIASYHGIVFSHISINKNVPEQFPFLDFVPGEVNRLTNYLDSDQYTNQSLIKRTPIRLESCSEDETNLWETPTAEILQGILQRLYLYMRSVYPDYSAQKAFLRRESDALDWLPWEILRSPKSVVEKEVGQAVASMAVFLQKFMNDKEYQGRSAIVLQSLSTETRDQFYWVLMPVLRKLDYSTALLPLLSACVGELKMVDALGMSHSKNLFSAHKSAVLELKEEVVGVQLYVAIVRGLHALYGVGTVVPRDDIAIVSGISIPCAADVPAYLMGVSPSEIDSGRLLHSRVIGSNSILIIDRKNNRAVKVDVLTGILPNDKELNSLRGKVIARKQSATRDEHRRFFDVLEELILEYVHRADDNLKIYTANNFPWQEYVDKLSFTPANRQEYRDHLIDSQVSVELTQALVQLDVLRAKRDREVIEYLLHPNRVYDEIVYNQSKGCGSNTLSSIATDSQLFIHDKVEQIINRFIAPVLENDGGQIDYLGFDAETGEVSVRFVGSCANCPCSMLSLETVVKPPLMQIAGVTAVVHRGKLKPKETRGQVSSVQMIDALNITT